MKTGCERKIEMVKNIEPKLKKIGDYLKLEEETVFVIPEYQRAYSWNTENCDKLWQDINDYIASDGKDRYFFGTIIINCQDDDTKYGLIDGQQRTTTFLLLMKALLLRINVAIKKDKNDEDAAGLLRGLQERRRGLMGILYKAETEEISDIPDDDKDAKLQNNISILKNYSINEQYKTELDTVLSATKYDDAKRDVVKIKYRHGDNGYTNFFRNFKFFYEKIGELSDSELNVFTKALLEKCEVIEIKSWQVEQAITMFNSLNSDGMPLNDSDIISAKLYAIAEGKGCGKEFTELWKQLNEELEDLRGTGVVNLDSILMQQMYYTRTVRHETVNDTGSVNVTTPGLRRYCTEINKDILSNPVELCEGMINLTKIWKKVVRYPIMSVLLKFNDNAKLFLASYFFRFNEAEISEEKVDVVLRCMLRLFVVLELVDAGYSSSRFKTFLFKEEVKLADPAVSVEEIKDDFDTHIRSSWNREDLKSAVSEYHKNMLVYLNEYLFARENGKPFEIGTSYDIEHIMPASGNNLSVIRTDAGIESDEEFRNLVNKLGNKILLEIKINRAIGNEWFSTKVSTTLGSKTGYIDSKYPIASALVDEYKGNHKPYWKKEDIRNATDKAGERIVNFIFD